MKALVLTVFVCVALAVCGCGGGDSSTESTDSTAAATVTRSAPVHHLTKVEGPKIEVEAPGRAPKKLEVTDLKKGDGVAAKPGDELTVQFTAVYAISGKPFESSWDESNTFNFTLDSKSVNPGWVKGLPGMRVGGRRKLVVPTPLTSRYPIPPGVGPEASLVYVVELLEARPPGAKTPATTQERAKPKLEVPDGLPPKKLVVKNIEKGTGPGAKDGDELTVHYVNIFYMSGKQLSPGSWGYGKPRTFTLGAGKELLGWEVGLKGMKAGGRRKLLVPSRLSAPGGVPPGTGPEAALAYIVDLVELKSP